MKEQLIKIPHNVKIKLKNFSADYTKGFKDKEEVKKKVEKNLKTMSELQDVLYAHDKYSILIILQAMDAGGKDGTIRHVMSGVNPQGCQVFSFKKPSDEELDHDYLWRIHKSLPERGRIGIFNRSYYEEVLVARVHPEILQKVKLPPELITKDIWKTRFRQINDFEKYLYENGTRIIKLFLHISKEEQKNRFLSRQQDPTKNWKLSKPDMEERKHWDEYMNAFEDMINNTSTKWAPWYIIPSNKKWFRNYIVSEIISKVMKSLDISYPKLSDESLVNIKIE
ncbi:MAG TPA: polyphosphate kinase 2 family protein [Bacteroidota bacterium]|nr:polyphosphate kinase 2 family protein [Bacteroidota bacterium]